MDHVQPLHLHVQKDSHQHKIVRTFPNPSPKKKYKTLQLGALVELWRIVKSRLGSDSEGDELGRPKPWLHRLGGEFWIFYPITVFSSSHAFSSIYPLLRPSLKRSRSSQKLSSPLSSNPNPFSHLQFQSIVFSSSHKIKCL